MAKKFPKEFNFFPETFSLPTDFNKVFEYLKTKAKNTFIVKPEAGA